MSNRRKTGNPRSAPAWLACPDCTSTVVEVFYGRPPRAALSIEVAHSPTCPAWRHEGRELAIAFLPPDAEDKP